MVYLPQCFGLWYKGCGLPSKEGCQEPGGFPRHFCARLGDVMRELSIFVDESGDVGTNSEYYLVALVIHDQGDDITPCIDTYVQTLAACDLEDIPFHCTPIMRGHDAYENLETGTRKSMFARFHTFVKRVPFHYQVFSYRKQDDGNDPNVLRNKMKRDIANFLFDNLNYFQSFDKVKIYYDDGQPLVTEVLHAAIEYALSKDAVVYRMATPRKYRLFQIADYICSVELAALKYAVGKQTTTDAVFFGDSRTFYRNFLKQIRRKRMA